MKKITNAQFKKVVRLENQLWDLQSKIYNLQCEFEDINENNIAESIGMAGFELDEAKNKMNDAIAKIKAKTN